MAQQETIKKTFNCPHCTETFDSPIELDMHTRKYHPGKTAPSQTFTPTKLTPTTQQPVKGEKLTQQEDLTPEYNLSESMQNLGLPYPVITDKYGNIIDGFHRLAIDPNCEKLSRDFINTPELLEAARIAANHDRRTPKPDEIKDRIIIMAKKGVSAKEISKLTGVPERTVYRIIPADLKKESAAKISETRKAQSEIVRDVLPNGSSSINIPDKKEINPHPPLGTAATYTPKTIAQTTEPEPETIPEGTPICPICHCSMDTTEYEEVKQAVTKKYGKQIQTLLFPTTNRTEENQHD